MKYQPSSFWQAMELIPPEIIVGEKTLKDLKLEGDGVGVVDKSTASSSSIIDTQNNMSCGRQN